MTKKDHPGVGKTIDAGGIATNYIEDGQGEALVFLHGSAPGVCAWSTWSDLMPEFSDQYWTLAPDIVSFGFTAYNPSVNYTMKHWAGHLISFLDAKGIKKATLVGSSFGGSVALAAAISNPDRVSRIVALATPCGKFNVTAGLKAGRSYKPGLENMRKLLEVYPVDKSVITDALVEERFLAATIQGDRPSLHALVPQRAIETDEPVEISGMPEGLVAKLDIPVLVMHGREDPAVPCELGLRLAKSVKNSEMVFIGNCGHMVQLERRELFIDTTRSFLRRTVG